MTNFIKWVRGNYLIISLVLIVLLILAFPLFIYGINGAFFYRFDPDIVYIGNALLYTKAHVISYFDHPGTPTIMLFYYLFIPLRMLSKYFLHIGFVQWSFDNFALLVFFLRIFELALFGTSLFIFLKSVKSVSKSILIIVFAWFAFFCLSTNWRQAISIVPENFSFLLTGLWLLVFVKFIEKRAYFLNLILVFISGFAVANKFTSAFLLIPSLLFPFFSKRLKIDQKFGGFAFNIAISAVAFFLGIWPILNRLTGLLHYWVGLLFYHGETSIFDLATYSKSALSLISAEPVAFTIICLTTILAAYLVIKRRLKIDNLVVFLLLTTLVGILIFAKSPSAHYSFVNYILVVFCASYFLSKVKTNLVKIVIPFLAIPVFINIHGYLTTTSNWVKKEVLLQNYLDKNPARINTLWGINNKFNIINNWTAFWASNVFGDQFTSMPVIMIFEDIEGARTSGFPKGPIKNVFAFCWDKAYLPKERAIKFLAIYHDRKLEMKEVPVNNSIYQISSNHCTTRLTEP